MQDQRLGAERQGAAVRRKTMKNVMLWAGAGQIGTAIGRRMGAG